MSTARKGFVMRRVKVDGYQKLARPKERAGSAKGWRIADKPRRRKCMLACVDGLLRALLTGFLTALLAPHGMPAERGWRRFA